MRARWEFRAGIVLTLIEGLAPAPLLAMPPEPPAAQVEVGSEGGLQNPPNPTEGEDIITEEEFNPTITCTIGPGGTIYDLIECLLDRILNPPPPCDPHSPQAPANFAGPWNVMLDPDTGEDCVPITFDRSDFTVTALSPPSFGVEISRVDGLPMERILFREKDPGIQTTEIRIENSQRTGRLGEVSEMPACNGSIFVGVNDVTVEIPTSAYCGPFSINTRIVNMLRASGFLVLGVTPYIHIIDMEPGQAGGIRRLQFRSTDSGITASDLALLMPSDPLGSVGPGGGR